VIIGLYIEEPQVLVSPWAPEISGPALPVSCVSQDLICRVPVGIESGMELVFFLMEMKGWKVE
jgi:hypothetical protein